MFDNPGIELTQADNHIHSLLQVESNAATKSLKIDDCYRVCDGNYKLKILKLLLENDARKWKGYLILYTEKVRKIYWMN